MFERVERLPFLGVRLLADLLVLSEPVAGKPSAADLARFARAVASGGQSGPPLRGRAATARTLLEIMMVMLNLHFRVRLRVLALKR